MSRTEIKRILLTGASGQLGSHLKSLIGHRARVFAPDRSEFNLAEPESIRRGLAESRPDLIINCAAYTQVDRAEEEPETARAVNAEAPALLAGEAARLGAALVHFSTDYVYDGEQSGPYLETDPVNPLSVYGETKAEGDRAIASSGIPHLIFRTSWVYSERGRNFLQTILRLASERPELKIVDDQVGAPTWSFCLARGTLQVLDNLLGEDWQGALDRLASASGVYHMTCAGKTTWYGFARAILEKAGLPAPPRLIPIPSSEYPVPARRPKNSVLDNSRLKQTFGVVLPPWEEALSDCLQRVSLPSSPPNP